MDGTWLVGAGSGTGTTLSAESPKIELRVQHQDHYRQANSTNLDDNSFDRIPLPTGALNSNHRCADLSPPTMRPTQALSVGRYRHLKLTVKDVNKGFYKGNRTGSMGRHTKYGGYVIEWNKVRTYVVPEGLKDFKVGSQQEMGRARIALTMGVAHSICEPGSQGPAG